MILLFHFPLCPVPNYPVYPVSLHTLRLRHTDPVCFTDPDECHLLYQAGSPVLIEAKDHVVTLNSRNQFVLLPPNGYYRLLSARSKTTVMHLVLRGSLLSECFFSKTDNQPIQGTFQNPEEITRALCLGYQKDPTGIGLSGLMYQLLLQGISCKGCAKSIELTTYFPLETTLSKHEQTLCDIHAYLCEHYPDVILLEELANLSGMSNSTLCRLFLSHTGLRPMDYINRYRISFAKILLEDPVPGIKEIANQVGIESVSYFDRLFRRQFGYAPRRKRKATPYSG